MSYCGKTKTIDGGTTLCCNLEPGHAGKHGVRESASMDPFVTWEEKHVITDAGGEKRGRANRSKRRQYTTLKVWKAGQP